MGQHHSEAAATPWFDMELFMTLSQETRIGGEVMERLERLWSAWAAELTTQIMKVDGQSYLLVSLGDAVERAVDAAWTLSPAEGFRHNALAQTLCMAAVQEQIPEIADSGCAPAPRPSEALAAALREAGVPYRGQGPTLERRFATLTAHPFRGGCETCCMAKECPRTQNCGERMSSVLLPGHEERH